MTSKTTHFIFSHSKTLLQNLAVSKALTVVLITALSGFWLTQHNWQSVSAYMTNSKGVDNGPDLTASSNKGGSRLNRQTNSQPDSIGTISQFKIAAADGLAEGRFGRSVAISGDIAIVGNPNTIGPLGNNQPGTAYIFIRNPNGTWSQQAKLFANDTSLPNSFGWSVEISGNTVVVGAFQDDIGANTDQGSAYVFVRSGTSWTQQAKLIANDGAASDQFGFHTAISGETIIVGSLRDDFGASTDRGSAYVFVRNGTNWAQQQKLMANDGVANDLFGVSVALSGDTAIVSAYLDDVGANEDQGSAYIFVRNGATWTQQQRLTADDGAANAALGVSVAIEGDTVVVGKFTGIPLIGAVQGAAYVFVRNGMTWTQQQKLLASGGVTNNAFGESVGISKNRIVVGVLRDSIGNNSLQGSAYIFTRTGTTWTEQQRLMASDGAGDDQFGSDVAISGNKIIVGAFRDDNPGFNQGSAYIFTGFSDTGKTPFDFDGDSKTDVSVFRAGIWYLMQSANGFSGVAFGEASDKLAPGDYDGDNKTDIAVFRPSDGYWYIINSSNGAFRATQLGQSGDFQAPSDYDGDGKSDICVFRPSTGTFYLLYSSDNSFHYQQWGTNEDVPVMGDYDGDAKTDFSVYRLSTRTFYILRSSDGMVTGQQWGSIGDKPIAGDFDGDGKTDITVYRPATRGWYYLQSSGNGFRGIIWGASGDIPAAGDYDGDGSWDVAVFRPSTGTFYILQSTTSVLRAEQFGTTGDVPVPAAYLP